MMLQTEFNQMIGELDHLLSRLKIACSGSLTEANRQTLAHHADDMEGMVSCIRTKLALMPQQREVQVQVDYFPARTIVDRVLQRWPWLRYKMLNQNQAQFYEQNTAVFGTRLDRDLEDTLHDAEKHVSLYLERQFVKAPSLELLRRLHEGWQIVQVGRTNYCARRNSTALERFGDLQYLHDDLTRIESGVNFNDKTVSTFTAEHI